MTAMASAPGGHAHGCEAEPFADRGVDDLHDAFGQLASRLDRIGSVVVAHMGLPGHTTFVGTHPHMSRCQRRDVISQHGFHLGRDRLSLTHGCAASDSNVQLSCEAVP